MGIWESSLAPVLSQGDILLEVAFYRVLNSAVVLKGTTIRGNRPGWREEEAPISRHQDDEFQFVATGRFLPAIVLNHGCDIDKNRKRPGIIVAPVSPIAKLEESYAKAVRSRRVYHSVPLLEVPKLGDCYADLRQVMFVDRVQAEATGRACSMNDLGRDQLQKHIVMFYARPTPAV